jgi:hypothetical protein
MKSAIMARPIPTIVRSLDRYGMGRNKLFRHVLLAAESTASIVETPSLRRTKTDQVSRTNDSNELVMNDSNSVRISSWNNATNHKNLSATNSCLSYLPMDDKCVTCFFREQRRSLGKERLADTASNAASITQNWNLHMTAQDRSRIRP